MTQNYVAWFEELGSGDVARVGGKNASLGELVRTQMIPDVVRKAHESGVKIGICGQAPSNYPEFAEFLVREGIDSISLNPDSFVATVRHVAEIEKRDTGGQG